MRFCAEIPGRRASRTEEKNGKSGSTHDARGEGTGVFAAGADVSSGCVFAFFAARATAVFETGAVAF